MQLLRLVASHVKVRAPLPFNVRDEHGNLLLAAGQVIDSERQPLVLLSRGIHADVEEIKALAAGRQVKPLPPTLFARWQRCFWNLDAMARPDLPIEELRSACEELGDALIALMRQAVRRDTALPDFALKGLETDKTLVARVPLERVYGLLT